MLSIRSCGNQGLGTRLDRGGGGGGGGPPPQNLLLKIHDFLYGTHDDTERATILPIVVGGVIVINVPAHRM